MTTPLQANWNLTHHIAQGLPTIGTFLGLGSPMSAEICAAAGLDFVLHDLEHGGGSEHHIGDIVAAAGAYGTATIVRIEQLSRIRIGRALDAGAAGVMMPRISGVQDVIEMAKHLAYPPEGDRGVASYNRAAAWTLATEQLDHANERVVGIIQIETLGAVGDVVEIASQPSVDVLFIGPQDLSYALGVPRQFSDPRFQEVLDEVVRAAKSKGKAAGILANDRAAAERYLERGFTFVAIGSDATLLAQAAKAAATPLS